MIFYQPPTIEDQLDNFEAAMAIWAEHYAEIAAEAEAVAVEHEAAIAEAKRFRQKFARGDRRRQNRQKFANRRF